MKNLAIMLVLLSTAGCSLGDNSESKGQQAHQPKQVPAKRAEVPMEETPPARDRVEKPPAYVPAPNGVEPDWGSRDEPRGTVEDLDMAEPTIKESQTALLEHLTSMYGVRLPHSSSRLNLEGTIGTTKYVVALNRPPAPGVSEFAREILISVSKRDIVVNDYKVADISCFDESGNQCSPAVADEGGTRRYQVASTQLSAAGSGSDAFVIMPLLKQLQHFQKGRSALLAGLSDRAVTWLMDCDAYTLVVDQEIPYLVLAQVIHTAAFSDLTRARLVVLDDNEALAYIPLLSPRLAREQKESVPIIGGDWWQSQTLKPSVDFPVAYLGYSASLHPDDFGGLEEPALPSCFPLSVAWDTILLDSETALLASGAFMEHIAGMSSSHSVLLGLSPSLPVQRPHRVPESQILGLLNPEPAPEAPTLSPEEPEGGGSSTPGLPIDGFPDNRVLPPPDAAGDEEPVVDAPDVLTDAVPGSVEPRADEPPQAIPADLELTSFVFLMDDGITVAIKGADGRTLDTTVLKPGEPERLYSYLDLSTNWLVNVGAIRSMPVKRLVTTLDTVRHRCSVYSMSGKCKRWQPVQPSVYLFMAPGDRFQSAPVAPTVPDAEPAGAQDLKDPPPADAASPSKPDGIEPAAAEVPDADMGSMEEAAIGRPELP